MNYKLDSLEIYQREFFNMFQEIEENLMIDIERDLRETSPKDDTSEPYSVDGHRAWLMDDIVSREEWIVHKPIKFKGTLLGEITNINPAIIALTEGFINVNPKMWANAYPVERTKNGQFSEQSPKGDFIYQSLLRAFKANNFKIIEKSR
jgi:hypothetical protein